VRGEWSPEELVESWTLLGDDWKRVGNKSGATRLGFAVLLKFFELEARFPRAASDVPPGAVPYVAEQVGVPAARFADYWQAARAVKRHRVEIRGVFGFREATRADEETWTAWLAEEVCPVELGADELVDAVLVRCRALQIEPPGRTERIVGSARARFEQRFCAQTVERLGSRCVARLEALVDEEAVGLSGQGLLAQLKADPRRVGLETLLREIDKLAAVRGLELPADLFADCSEKLVDAWRARAARLYPSDLRASPVPIRLTLLGALCRKRQSEITDALVDLLIGLVHKVNATAEQRVEKTLTDDLKRVRGKHGILFRLAAAAVEQPDETVRRALFPVVGEGTLRDLVREAEASNRERRTMGWLDEGIEPGWVRAAAAVADVLAQEPVDWLVSSRLARAVPTAAPLAALLSRQPIVDDRFGELRVGHWEGYTEDEIAERWPEHWQRWRSEPHALEVEGRETLADLNARVAGALDELFADLVDGRVAVVFTHDAVVRAAVAWALGTGPEIYRHVEVANCSITTVGVVAGVRRLVRTNENAHLEGLALEP
jgi:broad specificity phosphatase PhoE